MKKIEFNGQRIAIPTSWDEIELGDYEKWYTDKSQDPMSYVRYIADLCKIEAEKLLDESEKVFKKIENIIRFASNPNFEPSQTVTIDFEIYTVAQSDKLTLGEWIDMDSIINSESETSLSDMLAIVCRPIEEAYNQEKAMERAKLFRKQSCEKMMPLVSFFLNKKQKFNETLNHSSTVAAAANQYLRDTKTFVVNGDGIKRLPIWQRGRYSSLMKSLEKELAKFMAVGSCDMPNDSIGY